MTAIRNPLLFMRRAFWPALGTLIIAYFLGSAVMGETGVLAWGDYSRAKAARAAELAGLEERRAQLAQRAQLLDPRNADPDLVDEMVRSELRVIRPDEVIVPLDDAPAARPAAAPRR
jgi:cell division protein FtsB